MHPSICMLPQARATWDQLHEMYVARSEAPFGQGKKRVTADQLLANFKDGSAPPTKVNYLTLGFPPMHMAA